MKADIIYRGGLSCTIGPVRFRQDEVVTVQDPELIKCCRNTAGFEVHVVEQTVRQVMKQTVEKPAEVKVEGIQVEENKTDETDEPKTTKKIKKPK